MELDGRGGLLFSKGKFFRRNIDARFYIVFRCVIYMGMGMLMACARILDDGAPLGMSMVACSGAGMSGVFSLLGASVGYLLSGGFEWGIRYVASSVLVYTISFVFHEVKIYRQEFFMPCASAIVMAVTGFLAEITSSVPSLQMYAGLVLETASAFGCTYFFREALSNNLRTTESEELKHSIASMIMAAGALMAFSNVLLFSTVSVGRVLALLLVMASAARGGMLTGAAVGTVLGMAMDITGVGAPFY